MNHNSTIEMLVEALKAQPGNKKLRMHIAELMVEDGDIRIKQMPTHTCY